MGSLLLLLLIVGLLALAVSSGRHMVSMILITGGFPLTVMMPGTTFFQFAGGIAPQAAYLFAIVLTLIIALAFNTRQVGFLAARWNLFLAFLIFAAASLFWADSYIYGLRFLAKLMAPFLLVVAIITFLNTDRHIRSAERAILICCLLVLALALLNHFSNGALGDLRNQRKWVASNTLTAPFMSPANFSFLLGSGAILALSKCFERHRAVALAILVVFLGAIFWAFTRIAMAGVAVGCGIVLMSMIRSRPLKIIIPALLGVIFLGTLLTSSKFMDRMFFEGSSVDASSILSNPGSLAGAINTSGRTFLWEAASREFRSTSKIEGAGLGSVDIWLIKKFDGTPLHSDYYRLYLDLGVIGLLIYVFALLQIGFTTWKLGLRNASAQTRRRSAVGVGAIFMYAITLATDNSLNYVTEFGFYVFALAAFAIASSRVDAANRSGSST